MSSVSTALLFSVASAIPAIPRSAETEGVRLPADAGQPPFARRGSQNLRDYTGFATSRRKPRTPKSARKCAVESGGWTRDPPRCADARRTRRRSPPSILSPCCANSGSSSRRPARCASPRCSSSSTLRPDLLPRAHRAASATSSSRRRRRRPSSRRKVATYADAAKKAMPAVVNIYTSKEVRSRNPLADDPLFRRYFPDLDRGATQRQTSLGSGVIVSPEGYVHHQPSRDPGRRRHPARAERRPPRSARKVRGTDPESDLAVLKADADEPAGDHVRPRRGPAGRRRRAGDRQSVRTRQHGDARHRQRARAQLPGRQPLRGLHPDRRRDQSGQLGRRADRHRGQPGRHQQHDLLADGRLDRHRASRFRSRSRATCSSRSSATAKSRAAGSASSRSR